MIWRTRVAIARSLLIFCLYQWRTIIGYGTVVELAPHNLEIKGSNPIRCSAFFPYLSLFLTLSSTSYGQVPRGFSAMQFGANQAKCV